MSVLFADLVAPTQLGELLDAEAVRWWLLDRYFDESSRIIEGHGGTVEKYIGDTLMAVFGVATEHEDDALRGVLAAHEMRQALDALNPEFESTLGVGIRPDPLGAAC